MTPLADAWQAIADRPFAELEAFILRTAHEGDAAGLLPLLADLPDREPLATAIRALHAAARLDDDDVQAAVLVALRALDAAGLARVLDEAPEAPSLQGAALSLLERLPDPLDADAMARASFLLRWVQGRAPEVFADVRQAAIERANAAVVDREPGSVSDADLLAIPGAAIAELDASAWASGCQAGWGARRDAFARRVLEGLARQQKSLSLARAEALLSRRVYTDPAHCLVELLQNAEDAGATRWRVRIDPDAVHVWHDGTPFDARDVVGVLSIGQTTKNANQIGLFGVGFKSVYAICERPQIYSDVWLFEVADVSLPRPLATRPAGAATDGTLLVLPLRSPDDPGGGAQALADRAHALSAHVLLTLRNITRISIDALGAQRVIARADTAEPGIVQLSVNDDRQDYLLAAHHRSPTRVPDDDVLIALPLTPRGRVTGLPEGVPQVHCYLPTTLQPGLRFLLHARFELPVDRERIDASAPANRAAIARAGRLLAEQVERRLGAQRDVADLLNAAPLPDTLGPGWDALAVAFTARVADLHWVRTVADLRVRPREAQLLTDATVAHALAGHPTAHLAVLTDARLHAHAEAQGARIFDGPALRAMLADAIGALDDGDKPPLWLRGALRTVLRFAARLGANLDGLPIWPDDHERVHRRLQRAPRDLRALASPARPTLAPAFDDDPQLAVFTAKLPRLTADDVLADLSTDAEAICAEAGVARVLRWLSGRSDADLQIVADAPLCPDERGALRVASTVWRATDDAIGRWVTALRDRPPLVDPGVAGRHASVIARLGVRRLDLLACLEALAVGAISIDDRQLTALHGALAETTQTRSPQANRALADAAIWPDAAGVRRRLTGEDAARVPTHDDLREIATDVPWLRADLARAEHVARLEVRIVTPAVLARALITPSPTLPITDVDGALRFLAQQAKILAPGLRAELADAPIWAAEDGARHALGRLRAAANDARVAAVYAGWRTHPRVAPDAAICAARLGLTVIAPDAEHLLRDLADATFAEAQALPSDALMTALAYAGARLPPSRLTPALRLPVYALADGGRAALGSWDAPDTGGAHRVPEDLVDALDWTGRLRLHPSTEATLRPLLEALSLRAAGFEDVIEAVADGAPMPAAVDAIRAAVVRLRDTLPPGLDLANLAIWPTQAGAYAAAKDLLRPGDLQDPIVARIITPPPETLLDAAAAIDAEAVGDQIEFGSVTALMVDALHDAAVVGEPLDAQVPWLSTVGDVLRVLHRLAQDLPLQSLTRLPLVVDALGRLSIGPRFEASFDEITTVVRTPFVDRLAEPTWATGARSVAVELAPVMPVRAWLEALATHAPEPVVIEAHPTFVDPEARAALYRALLARMAVITGDANARAALGRAAILPTAEGMLRPPTSLLFDPTLPDLDLSWNPTEEVPEALRTWMRSAFDLDRKRVRVIVDHVVDGLHASAERDDGFHMARLLDFLARALRIEPGRPQHNAEIAARHKLRKRLKAQARTGAFVRPKSLMVLENPDDARLLQRILRDPPLVAHPSYSDRVRAMLQAAGAPADLTPAAIDDLLHDPSALVEGVVAYAAFARYIAERAVDEPGLVHALNLPERAFVPDGQARLRTPASLYWPTPAVIALLGEAPSDAPHPAFAHELPEAAWRAVGFRDAADARLEDVLARVLPGACLDEVVLRWLDDQLDAGRLKASAVRAALTGLPVFLTDDDRRHPPETLIRDLPPGEFGRRRGGWSAGRTLPRLTSALRIPAGPAMGHYLALLDEISTAFIAQGQGLLQAEPELLDVIPRAWARLLAEGGAPARGVVVAEGPRGAELAWTTEPSLVWPEPAALMQAALDAGVRVRSPRIGEADVAQLSGWLRAHGVPAIGALWEPASPGVRAQDLTPVVSRWIDAIQALWSLLPLVRRFPGEWRADVGAAPRKAMAARALWRSGRVRGERVRWPVAAAILDDALVVMSGADGPTIAEAVCRDRLLIGAPDPDRVQLIADVLACKTVEPMTLLLEARLQARAQAPAVKAPDLRQTMHGGPRPSPGQPAAPKPDAIAQTAAEVERKATIFGRFRRWLSKPPTADDQRSAQETARPQPPSTPPPPPAPPPPAPRAHRPTEHGAPRPLTPRGAPAGGSAGAGSAAPPGRRDHAGFFRPRGSVGPQLDDGRGWLDDRAQPAVYGFAVTPRRLPTPFMYGPQLIADRFDPRTQHWTAESVDPAWRGAPEGRHRVAFAGKLPPGESVLPMPLYARLISVDATPKATVVRTAGDLPMLSTTVETTVRYEVALCEPPDFAKATNALAPPALTRATVPDTELPAECHALVDRVAGLAPLDRVLAVRDFVRSNYRYDPTRFEDPRLAGWLRRVSRGRANAQLAALHAARDGRHLGAGVCYELNVLVVELLRRSGVPAAVATGWVFERGQVDEPDHLWAVALMGTEIGPRWMPVDAASTRDGRPLRVRPRTATRWSGLLPSRERAPKPAAWSSRKARVDADPLPLSDLVRVARHVEALTGEDLRDEGALRARCRALLADPKTAQKLAALLRADPP